MDCNPILSTPRMKTKESYKVIVVGNSGSGKTSIIKRYVGLPFETSTPTTAGVDFSTKNVCFGDELIQLQLWDIGGQERYGSMTDLYYKNALGAVIVFDITAVQTYESVPRWQNDITSKLRPFRDIPIILLSNKTDLIEREGISPSISSDDLNQMVDRRQLSAWFPVSAKTGSGVEDAFGHLVQGIKRMLKENPVETDEKIIRDLKPSKYNTLRYQSERHNNLDDSCCLD
eukprot:TRINITY_DN5384_c0_g1_i2.p1 TRINITY_DN5384_c0_g1~~TRINITY_DN5384_c0_g1_i2.p1  ORF type:complete len:230 (+),score=48.07 TRINITY_DN5384_c0_g1_i2:713-1402(+)